MIKSKPVCIVTVLDPDTNLPVELEIRKLESGPMVGLDSSFLAQLDGTPEDSYPMSPYDYVFDPDLCKNGILAMCLVRQEKIAIHVPDDETETHDIPHLYDPRVREMNDAAEEPDKETSLPNLRSFVEFLKDEPNSLSLHFREDSSADNRYELTLTIDEGKRLGPKMAEYFGCPDYKLESYKDGIIVNQDNWNGEFRELADELTTPFGEFFDCYTTLGEIRKLLQPTSSITFTTDATITPTTSPDS